MTTSPAPTGSILVGVDRSELSQAALRWAAAEAERVGAALHVVYVFVYIHAAGGYAVFDPGDPAEVGGEVCEEAVRTVRAEHPDLPVTTEVRVGQAAPQLIDASRQAGMVVLGARGHGRLTGMLIGSVSQQVAMHAHCPVVVVRGDHDTQRPVVVGMDGSAAAAEALRFGLRHAAAVGVPLRVVRAEYVETPGVPPGEWYEDLVDQMKTLTATVRETVEEAARDYPSVDVEVRVSRRHPVRALVGESTDASLLVVASRGLGGFKGLLLGSVSQGVLSRADVPVAVVSGSGAERGGLETPDTTART